MKIMPLLNEQLNFNYVYFEAEKSNKVVLIVPATGVKRHLYEPFATFLAEHGYSAIIWDWSGIATNLHGLLKQDKTRMEDWATGDLNKLINLISKQSPDAQIFAVGHSFGGQAFGLAQDIHKLKALVTVAAQSGYWKHWPLNKRYQMAALWYVVMPISSHVLGYFPAKKLGLGENLPKTVALQWASWCRNPNYLHDYAGHEKMT